jgi:rfaE bifunctional protein nucleotidyltransferase chain/domain
MHRTVETKTVLAHGCFDLLHLGHIRHLQEARALGDRLVVSVTADEYVSKGLGRPRFTVSERVEALRALSCVDDVVINHHANAVPMIEALKPAVYVKGLDYKEAAGCDPAFDAESAAVCAYGGCAVITTSAKLSSSRLLNGERFSKEVDDYLSYARNAGFRDRILASFDAVDNMRLLFVGEWIIDEYRFVAPLAKPSKELILATVEDSTESFDGGVIAASKHADWRQFDVMSSMPLRKTRYIDRDAKRKLFEVYSSKTVESDGAYVTAEKFSRADAVIVFDFGHGMIDDQMMRGLSDAKFIAVNAQSNAGNYGFNPVCRYSAVHPNLVSVDDPEARLATGMQFNSVEEVAYELLLRSQCQNLAITHGRHGAMTCDMGDKMRRIPAFADTGVDTIGAGDAFLAVAGPLFASGLDLEMAAFAGNVAGAIKCSIVGHRRHVTRQELVATIEALLA